MGRQRTVKGPYSSDDLGKDRVRRDRSIDDSGNPVEKPRSIAAFVERNSGFTGPITKDKR